MNKTSKKIQRGWRKRTGKKAQLRVSNRGRKYCYQQLNLDFDTKVYLPLMNQLRNQGYWLPYWLDLHPQRRPQSEPSTDSKIRSQENVLDEFWNKTRYLFFHYLFINQLKQFSNIFFLREKSKPQSRPGSPSPSTPPVVYRLEPPKPTQQDLDDSNTLQDIMPPSRLFFPDDKIHLRRKLK
ncbi:hypothetical protein RFI_38393 [Reticulomyxa filosa]|uniref:Uncharacterized protein n=1 Tax=Reticulomyxa filosa TaxID=46433 RepID=X6LEB3_RETFI|nr:hypothetical protein RFI_38393 [Reticulomyxa filosa]|eukprot:ETN99094.1 hypothetical protein RFI_38393 [Reticulomyxa filosa]